MSISKEQWLQIETALARFHCQENFVLQGNEIIVSRVKVSEGKLALMVFINNEVKGAWMIPSSENFNPIVQELWRTRTKALYPPSKKQRIEKALGKRMAKKYYPKLNDVQTYYDPIFLTAKSLVRQFRKIKGLEYIAKVINSETPA